MIARSGRARSFPEIAPGTTPTGLKSLGSEERSGSAGPMVSLVQPIEGLALGGRASWPSEPHLQFYPSIPLFIAVGLLFFATRLRL